MKKLIIFVFATLMVVGCAEKDENGMVIAPEYASPVDYCMTVTIDSCQYVQSGYKLAHKGNCSFCKERRRIELQELVNQIKSQENENK